MWLTQEEGLNYKHSFEYSEKIFEEKTAEHEVGVYKTNTLGNTLVVDGEICYSELDASSFGEMSVHVPMCSHKEPSEVALIGAVAPSALELLRHKNVQCDVVELDNELISVQEKFFDAYKNFSTKFSNLQKSAIEYVRDSADASLDIVISMQKDVAEFEAYAAHIARILKIDGLAVFETDSKMMDMSKLKELMQTIGKSFKIVMPYRIEMPSQIGGVKTFVLASKEYHPTADFILQRADLIDDLKFYNSDVHPAVFAMPNYIRSALKGIAKN